MVTSINPSYLAKASIDQLLGALEGKLGDTNHLANPDDLTAVDVDCYKKRARAIPRRLDTLRNNFAPLHKLPAELLLQIFQLIQPPLPTFPFPLCDSWKPGWLSITKVCGYWRSLALGSPSLWRTIAAPDPRIRDSHELQRWFFNNSNPMTIHLSQYHLTVPFLPPTHRLETLELILSVDMGEQWDILGTPIESLTTLSLRRNLHGGLIVVPQILGGQPSNVKKLFLSNLWCWPENNQTFQNISHLVLHNHEIPIADLLEMMNESPCLKALQLLQEGEWPDTPPQTPPSFPQLELLILGYPDPGVGTDRPTGIHSMRLSPTVEIYASGDAWDIIYLLAELSAERMRLVTLLDICFVDFGTEFSLKGTSARFSLDSSIDTIDLPLLYQAKPFPRTREVHFTFLSDFLEESGGFELLGLAEFFSYLPNLSTLRFLTQANYVPFLDAISEPSTLITDVFVEVLDSEDGSRPHGFSEAEWDRVVRYQKAGVTVIQHSRGTSSYRLVVGAADTPRYQPIRVPKISL